MKIGIIGYGRIGKIHYQNVIDLLDESHVSICDPKIANIKEDVSKYTPLHPDYHSLISTFKPNAVIICSPTPTHFSIIDHCCNKGIHVFCEKPVDLSIDQMYILKDLISNAGILFHVGFNRRYDPDFQLLKENILLDEIGKLHQLHIVSRDPGLPPIEYIESSGGIFMDMSIHDFDMARHLVGYEVNEVYAKGDVMIDDRLRDIGDIDTATIVLSFTNGVQCIIQNSRQSTYGYDQRIEAFGEKGLLKANNKLENRIELWNKSALQSAKPEHFFLERYAKSYQIEAECFLAHLSGKKGNHNLIQMNDAIKATQIAIAAKQSVDMKVAIEVPCDI